MQDWIIVKAQEIDRRMSGVVPSQRTTEDDPDFIPRGFVEFVDDVAGLTYDELMELTEFLHKVSQAAPASGCFALPYRNFSRHGGFQKQIESCWRSETQHGERQIEVRAGLTKEICARNATEYKFARYITDGFFIVFICLAIVNIGVGVLYVQRVSPAMETDKWARPMVSGCVFAVLLAIVIGCLVRELIHAVFDLADCALLNRNTPGASKSLPRLTSAAAPPTFFPILDDRCPSQPLR